MAIAPVTSALATRTRLPTNANSLYDIGFHSLVEWWHELGAGGVQRLGVGGCVANPALDQIGGRSVGPADGEHPAGLKWTPLSRQLLVEFKVVPLRLLVTG